MHDPHLHSLTHPLRHAHARTNPQPHHARARAHPHVQIHHSTRHMRTQTRTQTRSPQSDISQTHRPRSRPPRFDVKMICPGVATVTMSTSAKRSWAQLRARSPTRIRPRSRALAVCEDRTRRTLTYTASRPRLARLARGCRARQKRGVCISPRCTHAPSRSQSGISRRRAGFGGVGHFARGWICDSGGRTDVGSREVAMISF